MIKRTKKYYNYIFLILLSVALFFMRPSSTYYFGVKYITTFMTLDIMFSILFTFIFFKIYLDNYYNYVLCRNNIITRLGIKKYNLYIIKKVIINSVFLLFTNCLIDFILIGSINIIYLLCNVIVTTILIIILPKKKEYNYELLILLLIVVLMKLLMYKIII